LIDTVLRILLFFRPI